MKLFNLFVTPEAEKDTDKTAENYELKQPELGDKFIAELYGTFEMLRQHPEMFAKFKEDIRRGHLKKFPHSFYYQPDIPEELIRVLGVFAQAEDPERILEKLQQRMKNLKKR